MRLSGVVFKTARFRIGALALGLVGAVVAGPNVKAADALPGNGELTLTGQIPEWPLQVRYREGGEIMHLPDISGRLLSLPDPIWDEPFDEEGQE